MYKSGWLGFGVSENMGLVVVGLESMLGKSYGGEVGEGKEGVRKVGGYRRWAKSFGVGEGVGGGRGGGGGSIMTYYHTSSCGPF